MYRHALTTGAITGEDLRFDSGLMNCRPDTVALRKLAVVDGSAAMLVDAKTTDGKTVQSLMVIR